MPTWPPTSYATMISEGFTVQDAHNNGLSAADCRIAGYAIVDILQYYSAQQVATAGYTAVDLLNAGFSATNIRLYGIYTVAELKDAGYSASDLCTGGYSIAQLKDALYSDNDILHAGYIVTDLRNAGYTDAQILAANIPANKLSAYYSIAQLKAAGYSDYDILHAGYSSNSLRSAGYTAYVLRQNSYSIAQLKAAGYSPGEITGAGYTATQLQVEGYSIPSLKTSGYTDAQILGAGYSASILRQNNYSISQLKSAGYTKSQILLAEYSVSTLKTNGYTDTDILSAGCTATYLYTGGYSIAQLTSAGYTRVQILGAGFSASDLRTANYTISELKTVPYIDNAILRAGYSASILRSEGNYTIAQITSAGYTRVNILNAGFSASDLRIANYTVSELKSVPYTNDAILAAGYLASDLCAYYTIAQLLAANYTRSQILNTKYYSVPDLRNAGYLDTDILASGYSTTVLSAYYSIAELTAANYTHVQILSAGYYSVSDLLNAGYTKDEILIAKYPANKLTADYTVAELKAAGYTKSQILLAGYSVATLKNAAYTDYDILHAGIPANRLNSDYSVSQLSGAGYTRSQILGAGYSASALQLAFFTISELRSVPYSEYDILHAGYFSSTLRSEGNYTIAQLQSAGYTKEQILSAGYSVAELQNAAYSDYDILHARYSSVDLHTYYSISQLYDAGYSAGDVLYAGYPATELRIANFNVLELKAASYSDYDILHAGYSSTNLRVYGNYTIAQLKSAGYTNAQIALAGYSVSELKNASISVSDMFNAGYTATKLRVEGSYTITQLLDGGYLRNQVLGAGYSASDLRVYGHYSVSELKIGKYSDYDILHAGYDAIDLSPYYTATQLFSAGYTRDQVLVAGYSVPALKNEYFTDYEILHAGYSASSLSAYYSIAELLDANYTRAQILNTKYYSVPDLKTAGYLDADILSSGYPANKLSAYFSIAQLKAANYSDSQILPSGYSVPDLRTAGYSDSQILGSGYSATKLRTEGNYTIEQLTTAGYTRTQILGAGYTAAQLQIAGYSISELKTVPYSDSVILTAGFDAIQLQSAGYSASVLRQNGFTVDQLKTTGYTTAQILNAGYTASQLRIANYSIDDLRSGQYSDAVILTAGFNAGQLRDAGYSASVVRQSGYTIAQLKNNYLDTEILGAGYTASQLRIAGYSINDLRTVPYSDDAILRAGFSAYNLQDSGYTPAQLRTYGYSDANILSAGYSAYNLRTYNNYTISQLFNAAYTREQVLFAGYSASDLRYYGNYTISELKTVPYTDDVILFAGFNTNDLRVAGYTPQQLLNYGYSASTILDAGYSLSVLPKNVFTLQLVKNSGKYDTNQIVRAGYGANELQASGYTITQLKTSNSYTDYQILTAGYSAAKLNSEGNYSITQLLNAGYNIPQLLYAGYSARDLHLYSNVSVQQLQNATDPVLSTQLYSDIDILAAGFDAITLKVDGSYSALQLKTAGYTNNQILQCRYSISDLKAADDTSFRYFGPSVLRSFVSLYGERYYDDYSILSAIFPVNLLKSAGFTAKDLNDTLIIQNNRAVHAYSLFSIANGNYTASEMRAAGFTVADLKQFPNKFTNANILSAGYSAGELRAVNSFSASELRVAGYTVRQLQQGQWTEYSIVTAGYPTAQLRADQYGNIYSLRTLLKSDYIAYFDGTDFTIKNILSAGFSAASLRITGYKSAIDGYDSGFFTASQLKEGGYITVDVVNAGYSVIELKTAGYTIDDLRTYNPNSYPFKFLTVNHGYTADEFRSANNGSGYSVETLRLAGCSGINMFKYCEYTPSELRDGGFKAYYFNSVFSEQNYYDAGYTLAEVTGVNPVANPVNRNENNTAISIVKFKDAGYTPSDFYDAYPIASGNLHNIQIGWPSDTSNDNLRLVLNDLGTTKKLPLENLRVFYTFSAGFIKEFSYTVQEIVQYGFFPASEMKSAGFTIDDLRRNNPNTYTFFYLCQPNCYKASDFRIANNGHGYSVETLRLAGCRALDLYLNCQFTPAELRIGGFYAREFDGYFSVQNYFDAGYPLVEAAGATKNQYGNTIKLSDFKTAGYGVVDFYNAYQNTTNELHNIEKCWPPDAPNVNLTLVLNALRTANVQRLPIGQLKNVYTFTINFIAEYYPVSEMLQLYSITDIIALEHYVITELSVYATADQLRMVQYYVNQRIYYYSVRTTHTDYTLTDYINALKSTNTCVFTIRQVLDEFPATVSELIAAGATLPLFKNANPKIPISDLYNAVNGFTDLNTLYTDGGYTATDFKDLLANGNSSYSTFFTNFVKSTPIIFSIQALYYAGFAANILQQNNITATELNNIYDVNSIVNAGYSLTDLIDAGFTVSNLKNNANFTPTILKTHFTINQIFGAGFTVESMKTAQYTATDFHTAEIGLTNDFTNNYTVDELLDGGYTVQNLHDVGVSFDAIWDSTHNADGALATDLATVSVSGSRQKYPVSNFYGKSVSIAILIGANYELNIIHDGGYTISNFDEYYQNNTETNTDKLRIEKFKLANFSVNDIITYYKTKPTRPEYLSYKDAGFTAADFFNSSVQLVDTNGFNNTFTDLELIAAGYDIDRFVAAEYSLSTIYDLFTIAQFKTTTTITIAKLTEAGTTGSGKTIADIVNTKGYVIVNNRRVYRGYTKVNLKDAGYTAETLKTAGCNASALKDAGFTLAELQAAGFTPNQFTGVSFSDLYEANFTFESLFTYGLVQLANLGQCILAGYCDITSITQMRAENRFTYANIKAAGCPAQNLIDYLVSINQSEILKLMKTLGYVFDNLFSCSENNVNYTAANFFASGFLITDISPVTYTISTLLNAGYTIADFATYNRTKTYKYTVVNIRNANANISYEQLYGVGFSLQQLKLGGCNLATFIRFTVSDTSAFYTDLCVLYTALDMKNAGVDIGLIYNKRYTARDLAQAGYSAIEMQPYFTLTQIKNEFTHAQLFTTAYTASDYRTANFLVNEIYSKFTPAELVLGGYSYSSIITAGLPSTVKCYSLGQLKSSNIPVVDILNIYSRAQMRAAGYSYGQLFIGDATIQIMKEAGFLVNDIIVYYYTTKQVPTTADLIAIKTAGYTASEVVGKLTFPQMKTAGYTLAEFISLDLQPSTFKYPLRYSASDMIAAHYPLYLLYIGGYSSRELYAANVSIANMKTAGYNADAILNSGYSVANLLNAGYSLEKCYTSGAFSAIQLKNSDYTVSIRQLISIKVPISEICNAGYTVNDLYASESITAVQIKTYAANKYSDNEIVTGIVQLILSDNNNDDQKYYTDMFKAGIPFRTVYTIRMNYTPNNNPVASTILTRCKKAGYTIIDVYNARDNSNANLYNIRDVISVYDIYNVAGAFSLSDILSSGYSDYLTLKRIGVTASQFRENNVFASSLKSAMNDQCYTPTQFFEANYPASQLSTLFSAVMLKVAGYSLSDIKSAGYDNIEVFKCGFPTSQLKQQLYTSFELMDSNMFTINNLRAGGFQVSDLDPRKRNVPRVVDVAAIKSLVNGGFSETDIVRYFSISESTQIACEIFKSAEIYTNTVVFYNSVPRLKAGGYTVSQLIGIKTDADIINNYNIDQCRIGGVGLVAMHTAGVSATKVLNAGYTIANVSEVYGEFAVQETGYTSDNLSEKITKAVSRYNNMNSNLESTPVKKLTQTYGYSLNVILKSSIPRILYNSETRFNELKDAGYTVIEILSNS